MITRVYDYGRTLYGLVYDQAGTVVSDTMIINEWDYPLNLHALDNYLTDSGDYIVAWDYSQQVQIWRKITTDQTYVFKNHWYSWDYGDIRLKIVQAKNCKTFITYNSGSEVLGWFCNDNKHQSQLYRLYRNTELTPIETHSYNAAVFDDNLFFTVESNRHGETGLDIWGNTQSLADINFDPEIFRSPPGDDILYPNFPNPFNGVTHISYEILAYHKVKLTMYDVLGREVRVLVDKDQARGFYDVDLNAAGLASGIYFVKLEAFRTKVRKVIVIK